MKREIIWEEIAKRRTWCAAEIWRRAMDKQPITLRDICERLEQREQGKKAEQQESSEG